MVIAVCVPLEFGLPPSKVLRYNTDMRIKPILFFGVIA
jgi:hypothetical protein